MNFGKAIEALKVGESVQREEWNGKNMYIYLEKHTHIIFSSGGDSAHNWQYDPVIVMATAEGTLQPGWLASQADILAEDWKGLKNLQQTSLFD